MHLSRGVRLSAYRIEELLASGGMGDVYRATHLELGRSVAIKVLSDRWASGPEALERFRREARAASRLSHPNICTVHDFQIEGGIPFLVLELIEGATLEEHLAKGPVPLPEAMRIAGELADALGYAHALGFVHRDLKPGNVMLTRHGAKVLDFGLVRWEPPPLQDPAGHSPTGFETLTSEGHFLGTIPYMAPEQFDGRADARTDLWALGVILYEMLAGRRPFEGSNPAALASAILTATRRPLSEVRPEIPTGLERLVGRLLARDPDHRWQSGRDVATQLRFLLEDSGAQTAPVRAALVRADRRRRLRLGTAIGLGAAAGLVAVVALTGRPSSPDAVVAFPLDLPPGASLVGSRSIPAVSPGGDRMTFVASDSSGRSGLWMRARSDPRPEPVRGADLADVPFWSPDGASLGFSDWSNLVVMPAAGGPARTLAPVTVDFRGGTWSRGGVILFSPASREGLFRVPAAGGQVTPVTAVDRARGEISHMWPQFLPDGERFIYYVVSPSDSVRGIYLASLSAPNRRVRLAGSPASGMIAGDQLVYVDRSDLVARRLGGTALIGEAVVLARGVAASDSYRGMFGVGGPLLAYFDERAQNPTQLEQVSERGNAMGAVGPVRYQSNPTVSRDGRWLAVETFADGDMRIQVTELRSGRVRTLEGSGRGFAPVWSPDSGRLAFVKEEPDGWSLWEVSLDSVAGARELLQSEGRIVPTSWTARGSTLAFSILGADGTYEVHAVETESRRTSVLVDGGGHHLNARFSPDGRFIAYMASSPDRGLQVWAEPYPRTGLRCQLSAASGGDPVWHPDGSRVYYMTGGSDVMVADAPSDRCSTKPPRLVTKTRVGTPGTTRNLFDVLSDGSVLLNQQLAVAPVPQLQLILNWQSSLH